MGTGNQVKIDLDKMKTAIEEYETTITTVGTVVEDITETMKTLESDYMGEDADTLQDGMRSYLGNEMSDIKSNAEDLKRALTQGLEDARYCKSYCQHFIDTLEGGVNGAVNDNAEIPGKLFCDYDVIAELMKLCDEAEKQEDEIRRSTYLIESKLDLEIVPFDVMPYTEAVRAECDKVQRLEMHARNLENYASFVEATDTNLSEALRTIYDTFSDPEKAERDELSYDSLEEKIEEMQEEERSIEELIEEYGKELVDLWDGEYLIEALEHMTDLPIHYSEEEVVNMITICQTQGDERFIKLLASGNYEEAFDVNPSELSLGMNFVMADYAVHLIKCDQDRNYETEEFERYNSALLSSVRDASSITLESETYEGRQYKDVYLDMMIQGSALQLEAEVARLSDMDPYSEDYDDSYYTSCFKLHAILCTEDIIIGELHKRGEDQQCKISGLKINKDSTIDFSIDHYSPMNGEQMQEPVTVEEMKLGDGVQLLNDQEDIITARKEQERIIDQFFYSVCEEGLLAASDAVVPGAALASSVLNVMTDFHDASQNMTEVNHEKLMELIGSGAKYSIAKGGVMGESENHTAFLGIYNPDTLRAINSWSSHGVAGWSKIPKEKYDNICETIEKVISDENIDKEKKELLQLCVVILKGGYDFLGEDVDMEQFNKAIDEIHGYSAEATDDDSQPNLKTRFIDFVGDDRGVAVIEEE